MREGFARRLMIALYRSDRQADALRVLLAHPDRAGGGARARPVARAGRPADRHPQPRPVARRAGRRPGGPDGASCRAATPRRSTPPPPPSPVALPGPAVRAGGTRFVGRAAAARRAAPTVVGGPGRRPPPGAADGRGRRRQVTAGRPLRCRRPRARADRAVGPRDRRRHRAVRADGRGAAHRAADGVARRPGVASPPSGASSSLLLPELDQLVPGVRPERPDPSVERYLLFETVAELLHGESARAPAADRARRRAVGRRRLADDGRARAAPRADVADDGRRARPVPRRRPDARARPDRRRPGS